MADELKVSFKKRFASGASVEADFTLLLSPPAITVLLGPSGSGKTTILRALAGLDRPEWGRIHFAGEEWMNTECGIFLPARKRRIGYLFQEYALFPHLTVRQNIAYGLGRLSRSERERQVEAVKSLLQIDGWDDRYPQQLSGGEKQRVALARTLAVQPRLLILDEPLSALDTPVRERLGAELGDFLRRLQIPTVLVTHDRTEAQALADRLIVMAEGRVQQIGPVDEVFDHPANEAVARFLGFETVTRARVVETRGRQVIIEAQQRRLVALGPDSSDEPNLRSRRRKEAEGIANTAIRLLTSAATEFITGEHSTSSEVLICIRAADVFLTKGNARSNGEWNEIPGTVAGLAREGRAFRVNLDCGFPLSAIVDRETCAALGIQKGKPATAFVRPESICLASASLAFDAPEKVR